MSRWYGIGPLREWIGLGTITTSLSGFCVCVYNPIRIVCWEMKMVSSLTLICACGTAAGVLRDGM
jgi:hypothetical protein